MKDAIFRQLVLLGEATDEELVKALGVPLVEMQALLAGLVSDGRAVEVAREWNDPRRRRWEVARYKALAK